MSELVLYDDAIARNFEPFALTRPIGEMRAGAKLMRQRWEHALKSRARGFVSSEHLASFEELDAPPGVTGTLRKGTVLANSRFAPVLVAVASGDVWSSSGRVVAVALPRDVELAELKDGRAALEEFARKDAKRVEVTGVWMDQVWDFLVHLSHQLTTDIDVLSKGAKKAENVSTGGKHGVFVEENVTVEPHVHFDCSAGPVLIRRGATVLANTRIAGPCVIGVESIVGVDKISGCSIGDHCKVHGELSASILLGHANKSHDGFVGNSYFGRWVNLGAGTITSNLKNTYGTVTLWTPLGERDTGMQFLGTLFGDHVKTGIGATLTTGSVIGAGAQIWGTRTAPKVVPPFAWGEEPPYSTFTLGKFLDVARRVMSRRHVDLSERQAKVLTAAHKKRWKLKAKR
jgi:UDP-N-acetylglucosamine diphosphorylase / glucose-1-phosphate thymidylyltransferase / UDP-N-acetylgalactosamine diphosphorylase / glucosamine-1-phosphate N-acetyltransferase / galactosamine-1-phosphate N-acetyltransferase